MLIHYDHKFFGKRKNETEETKNIN